MHADFSSWRCVFYGHVELQILVYIDQIRIRPLRRKKTVSESDLIDYSAYLSMFKSFLQILDPDPNMRRSGRIHIRIRIYINSTRANSIISLYLIQVNCLGLRGDRLFRKYLIHHHKHIKDIKM